MKFSKNTELGIAIGTQINTIISKGNIKYNHKILYSYDKGITWDQRDLSGLSLS